LDQGNTRGEDVYVKSPQLFHSASSKLPDMRPDQGTFLAGAGCIGWLSAFMHLPGEPPENCTLAKVWKRYKQANDLKNKGDMKLISADMKQMIIDDGIDSASGPAFEFLWRMMSESQYRDGYMVYDISLIIRTGGAFIARCNCSDCRPRVEGGSGLDGRGTGSSRVASHQDALGRHA